MTTDDRLARQDPLKWWVLADIAHERNEALGGDGLGHCNHDESPPECIREGQSTAEAYNARIRDTPVTTPLRKCWFCKGEFPGDALIAGYDTFEEQRLACLACNERMSGNWRSKL